MKLLSALNSSREEETSGAPVWTSQKSTIGTIIELPTITGTATLEVDESERKVAASSSISPVLVTETEGKAWNNVVQRKRGGRI